MARSFLGGEFAGGEFAGGESAWWRGNWIPSPGVGWVVDMGVLTK